MTDDPEVKAADINAKTAISLSMETKTSTEERLDHMENVLNDLVFRINDLTRKYNLLMSQRFNGRSTSND